MCLYPKRIKNPKYKESLNNIEGVFNIPSDARLLYIEIPCGYCIECRKKKAREWGVRLKEELKNYHGVMVTLTFSEESIDKLCKEFNSNECNGIAYRGLRRFCERWRKIYKKTIRHFVITELGHEGTERIHLHGILFEPKNENNITRENLFKIWQYGWVHCGSYCNHRTINYILKYIMKEDLDHKGYIQKIYASKLLGKSEYIEKNCFFNYENTKDTITNEKGYKIAVPEYYKRKLWTSEQREFIRLRKEDEHKFYIGGNEYNLLDLTEQDKEEIRANLRRNISNRGNGDAYEKKLYSVRNIHTEEEIRENKKKNEYYQRKVEQKRAENEEFKAIHNLELIQIKAQYELYIKELEMKAIKENHEYIKSIWQKSN